MELEEKEKAEKRRRGKSGTPKGQKRKADAMDNRGRPKKKKWISLNKKTGVNDGQMWRDFVRLLSSSD